jgi:hypothetical protein
MKQAYKFNSLTGEFLEPIFVESDENGEYILPENCTFVELPQPNYKPKFDSVLNDWIEEKPMPTDELVNPMWDGIDWTETPPPPIDDVTLLKESDAFTMLQLMDTQQQLIDTNVQLADAHSKLDASQQSITDLQTQLSEQIQTNADLTLQLVMKGVL